ncbi:MAG: hypothetical protein J1E58_03585 [Prevotella sp.]|nr:hypothetical protein [Prevotella sp.]
MKQFRTLLFILVFAPLTVMAQGDVEINAENFPDANFRNYLLAQRYGEDGVISSYEIESIIMISVDSLNISSLKGIENFVALQNLYCNFNQLTSLDLSQNSALTNLSCVTNQLSELDLSHNASLTGLSCNDNQLKTLNVSNCAALTNISCTGNQLTTLDVSSCAALTALYLGYNQLTTLDISNCTALINLSCGNNQLMTLDVSNCTALTYLECMANQLTTLDVSRNVALTSLYCEDNQLKTLDVSENKELMLLYCGKNQLTSLDVSQNPNLIWMSCYYNQLTSLDVSKSPTLNWLRCSHNMIKGASMDALVESLTTNVTAEEYSLCVYDNTDNDEGNVCTKTQVAVAKSKGWTPKYYTGTEWLAYEGSDEDPSGIVLPNIEANDANTPIYDLSGKRVNNLEGKKGVYIIGGKKVLKK